MEIEQAMKILHPSTTLQALAEVEYFAGFNQSAKREAWDEACDEACVAVCDEIEKLQAENASLRDLLKLAVEDLKLPTYCCVNCLHGSVNEDICEQFDFDCKSCIAKDCPCENCKSDSNWHCWQWQRADKLKNLGIEVQTDGH